MYTNSGPGANMLALPCLHWRHRSRQQAGGTHAAWVSGRAPVGGCVCSSQPPWSQSPDRREAQTHMPQPATRACTQILEQDAALPAWLIALILSIQANRKALSFLLPDLHPMCVTPHTPPPHTRTSPTATHLPLSSSCPHWQSAAHEAAPVFENRVRAGEVGQKIGQGGD